MDLLEKNLMTVEQSLREDRIKHHLLENKRHEGEDFKAYHERLRYVKIVIDQRLKFGQKVWDSSPIIPGGKGRTYRKPKKEANGTTA